MSANKSKKKKTKHNKIHKKISKHIKNKKNKKTKKGGDSILDTAVKTFMDNLFFYVTIIIAVFTVIGIIWYSITSTIEKATGMIAHAPTKIAEAAVTKTAEVASAAATKTAEVTSGIAEVAVEEGVVSNPVSKAIIFRDEDAIEEIYDPENESFINTVAKNLFDSVSSVKNYFVGETKEEIKTEDAKEEDETTQLNWKNIDPGHAAKAAQIADESKQADEYFQKNADGTSSIDSAISSTITDSSVQAADEYFQKNADGTSSIDSAISSTITDSSVQAADEYFQKIADGTSSIDSAISSTITDSSVNSQVEINDNVIVSPYKPSDNSISNPNPSIDSNYSSNSSIDSGDSSNSISNPKHSNNIFEPSQNILKPESVPPALFGDSSEAKLSSVLDPENTKSDSSTLSSVSPTPNNSVDSDYSDRPTSDTYPINNILRDPLKPNVDPPNRLELPGARTFSGGNPYGPKKITIYKILGLLLLTLYLEHYK